MHGTMRKLDLIHQRSPEEVRKLPFSRIFGLVSEGIVESGQGLHCELSLSTIIDFTTMRNADQILFSVCNVDYISCSLFNQTALFRIASHNASRGA